MRPDRFLTVLFILALVHPAWAYLDPAVGSALMQGVLWLCALLAAGWYRLRGLFSRRPEDDRDPPPSA